MPLKWSYGFSLITPTSNLYKQLVEVDAVVPIGDPIAVIAEADEEVNLEQLVGKKEKKSSKPEEKESFKEKPKVVFYNYV